MLQLFSRGEFERAVIERRPNALHIQIWTALIALLVLKNLQLRARFGFSLSNLAPLLRQQLFVYRDLWAWIDQPFQPPPLLGAIAEQIAFSWSTTLDRSNRSVHIAVIGGFEIRPFFESSHPSPRSQAMEDPNDRTKRPRERLSTR